MVDSNNGMFQSAQHFRITGGEYITGHYTKNVYLTSNGNASSDYVPPSPSPPSPSAPSTGRDNLLRFLKDQLPPESTDSDHDDDDSPWDMFGPVVGSWVTTALTKKPEPFIGAWTRCASKLTSRIAAQQRDNNQTKTEPKTEPKAEPKAGHDRQTASPLSQVHVLMAEYTELSSSLDAMRQNSDADSARNMEESLKRMKEILEILESERTKKEVT